jgi:hypothetical protein
MTFGVKMPQKPIYLLIRILMTFGVKILLGENDVASHFDAFIRRLKYFSTDITNHLATLWIDNPSSQCHKHPECREELAKIQAMIS